MLGSLAKSRAARLTGAAAHFVRYVLTESATGKVILDEQVRAEHTATGGDAFYGPDRLRLANEGSARKNITALVAKLNALRPSAVALSMYAHSPSFVPRTRALGEAPSRPARRSRAALADGVQSLPSLQHRDELRDPRRTGLGLLGGLHP